MIRQNEGYSSSVRGWLVVAGHRIALAQVGPSMCVIRGNHSVPPMRAELLFEIDGVESRRGVYLPHGISPDSNEVELTR